MTRAARTTNAARGFTLIEIVLVLAISVIIMGGAVGLMVFSSDERALRNLSGEVELLAKRARTSAILHQTSYALEFSQHSVRLMPWAQASVDSNKLGRVEKDDAPATGGEGGQVEFRDNIAVSILRWNSDKWIPLGENTVEIWRFDPDGLCEPISVRYLLNKSSAQDTFHPLTASISDSQLEAK